MTIFVVDGKEHRLEMRDKNGIDRSGDFIGNTAHGMEKDEEGRYIATQEELEWWDKVITEHEEMNELIAQHTEKYGYKEVERVVGSAFDNDLYMQPKLVAELLKEAYG